MPGTFTEALERALEARKAALVPTPPPDPERPLYGLPAGPHGSGSLTHPPSGVESYPAPPPRPWWRRLFAPKFTEDVVRASQAMTLALQHLAGIIGQVSLHLEARRGPKVADVREWSRRLRAAADALDKMVEPPK